MYITFTHTIFRQCIWCKYHSRMTNICGISLSKNLNNKFNESLLHIYIPICNTHTIFCIQISTSFSSIQLYECSHVESELSCMLSKWMHCIVHLENNDLKDVKVTVVLCLQQWPQQFIHQLVHPLYRQIPLWQWELFLTVFLFV
jgi:hypothetical protein